MSIQITNKENPKDGEIIELLIDDDISMSYIKDFFPDAKQVAYLNPITKNWQMYKNTTKNKP